MAEKTAESEESLFRKETFSASMNAKGSGGRLDAMEVKLFSVDVDSNVRLDENERESKRSVFPGEPARDQAVKMHAEELSCSVYIVSRENAEDGNESKGDKSHYGEVSPKVLTHFTRQVTLGMVSGFGLFVRVTTTSTLGISSLSYVPYELTLQGRIICMFELIMFSCFFEGMTCD